MPPIRNPGMTAAKSAVQQAADCLAGELAAKHRQRGEQSDTNDKIDPSQQVSGGDFQEPANQRADDKSGRGAAKTPPHVPRGDYERTEVIGGASSGAPKGQRVWGETLPANQICLLRVTPPQGTQ